MHNSNLAQSWPCILPENTAFFTKGYVVTLSQASCIAANTHCDPYGKKHRHLLVYLYVRWMINFTIFCHISVNICLHIA